MKTQFDTKRKSNKAFMLLSALGILFVVVCHTGNSVGPFVHVFPYDSFFMPMFVFISGYFFKVKNIETCGKIAKYTANKFMKLMVPYLLWAVFYGVFVTLTENFGLLHWSNLTFSSLWKSVLSGGSTFNVNGAAWFVPLLFSVTIVYIVIRKMFNRIWNDSVALVVFVLIGAAAVYFSRDERFNKIYTLLLLKTAFFIQFYQFGIFFKKYLEKWFDSVNGMLLCLAMVAINLLLLFKYENITFVRCASMSGFITNNYFLPLITSVTGIFFWLKIAKALTPILGENKIINFISDNTFFIMIHHLFFANVFSAVLYFGMKIGINVLAGFNTAQFKASPWYIFSPSPWFKTAYFIFSVVATLLACKAFDMLMQPTKKLYCKLKEKLAVHKIKNASVD